jgi:hypothetical protein
MSKNFETILEQVHHLSRWEQLALIASIAQIIGEDEPDILLAHIIEENRRRLAAFEARETQAEIDKLVKEAKSGWWERNKDRFPGLADA